MIGAQTVAIDGSRFSVPTVAAYNPVGFGQVTQPQPIQNVNFPPMLPGGATSGGGGSIGESIGGYGTAGQNLAAAQMAGNSPFSLRRAPTVWTVLLLIIGLVMLSAVHWRKTTLGGARENAHLGPASEGGEAAV